MRKTPPPPQPIRTPECLSAHSPSPSTHESSSSSNKNSIKHESARGRQGRNLTQARRKTKPVQGHVSALESLSTRLVYLRGKLRLILFIKVRGQPQQPAAASHIFPRRRNGNAGLLRIPPDQP